MLTFFTDPYEDELLYGTISRYHYYAGNIDFKDTLKELFGKTSVVPTLYLPSNLNYLSSQLSKKYTADYFIYNHTVYPYYAPFITKETQKKVIEGMKGDGGKSLYTKIGITAGSICAKDGIYYCPVCSKCDLDKKGEVYIHRLHQLQGIEFCPCHKVKLKKYKIDKNTSSRIEFIRLDENYMDFSEETEDDKHIEDVFTQVGKSAEFLLNNRLYSLDKHNTHKEYKKLLDHKELLTINKGIKQRELHERLVGHYGKIVLEKLESSIDKDNEYNWLKVLSRNTKRAVHPLRHILFINLLGAIEEFFNKNKNKYTPFGQSPWPCLNPVSEHYKNNVINDLNITADYKTRVPVGTFSCDCGFIYSRKGPDKCSDDRYRIGRIKEFGHVWKNKLKRYLKEEKYGLRELGRMMKCDPKTILKFDAEFEIYYFDKSKNVNMKKDNTDVLKDEINIDEYKDKILSLMSENPTKTRTEIRQLCKKEYSYLYKYDKEWLYEILPNKTIADNKDKEIVDWGKRDKEILRSVKEKYNELIGKDIPIRITLSRIGRELGILSSLEKNLGKLPETKTYILNITESVRDFQIRRSKKIIDEHMKKKDVVRLWQVQRKAGIRTNTFNEIIDELESYITRGNYYQ
ncbi:MAG: TnsD family transposase [Anaeromicrobium sp.]|jgi:hypothetical protein|uniref:TnsD family transposase n=1 Tax=Anaeromicrobium sp. TaxID=1929132 RepID=UPI0025F3B55C|nr:TnsD family transposase [Anaeromicrobium sp.]MCT4594620.1 TnsD family transposase [Anaeromicrobium sp.]